MIEKLHFSQTNFRLTSRYLMECMKTAFIPTYGLIKFEPSFKGTGGYTLTLADETHSASFLSIHGFIVGINNINFKLNTRRVVHFKVSFEGALSYNRELTGGIKRILGLK